MRGIRYLLVVLVSVTGLAVAAKLVYSRNTMTEAAPPSTVVLHDSKPASITGSPARKPSTSAARVENRDQAPTISAPAPVQAKPRVRPTAIVTDSPVSDSPRTAQPADTILPDNQPPVAQAEPLWQATPRQLARDSAYVMVSTGRLQAAIAVLDAWVRTNPSDTDVALDLARLKARAGDWQGSLALYTALIERQRTAQFLFERGQTYLWSGDAKRGEADLLASEALLPRAETERQLGDHYRWQGDFARSAAWYRLALRKAPGDTIARNSMEVLDRAVDARLLLPGELSAGDLGSGAQLISDNAGFGLYSLRIGQAVGLGSSTVVTATYELRSAARETLGIGQVRLGSWGGDVAIARRIASSKLTASIGVLDNDDLSSSIVRGSFTADAFLGNVRARASVRRAPAYETLWAPRMIGVTGTPATTWSTQGSFSLPFAHANELYLMGEFVSVSDDNTRVAGQLAMRHRLTAYLSLVYAGSFMAYDRQTSLYYSPARHTAHSLGLEFARYRDQGFSFALRAAPGYAWMREPAGTADSATVDLSAFQFTTGLELGYRRGTWDLLFSSGLSNGREGGYQSRNALLYLRRAW